MTRTVPSSPFKIAERAQRIQPFYVMEVAKTAASIAQQAAKGDAPMIYLHVGEPDFTAPPLVRQAAEAAIQAGRSQYTHSPGLPELRERISHWYQQRFGLDIPASRILVTSGASAALQLACLALIDAGDEILMPDPSYPCNRQFVNAADGVAKLIACGPEQRFQLSAEQVRAHWGPNTRGVLLASPSNPTGTSIAPDELQRIASLVRERGGITFIDEIYLGLSYDEQFGRTALALPEGLGDDIISINSFSKYFNMTGWRLGWLVLPPQLVETVDRIAQNLYICANSISQQAALACFEPESIAEYERRRAEFRSRRDWFVPALNKLGFQVPVMPDGAFYAWADCTEVCKRLGVKDSWELSFAIMERAHVAVTPGRDFGTADTARYLRFSFASSLAELQEAVARIEKLLG